MRRHLRRGAAALVLVVALACGDLGPDHVPLAAVEGAAGPTHRWVRPDQFQVSLAVVHALEEGPVVCTVTLKNVGSVPVEYATSMFDPGAYCRLECRGKRRTESPLGRYAVIIGNVGPYMRILHPGSTESETFYLHHSFLSLPPGKATVRFGWRVYRVVDDPRKNALSDRRLDLLFDLKRSQELDIPPATARDLAQVQRLLDTELSQVVKRTEGRPDCIWCSGDEAEDFVRTVKWCRHKGFVPLLLGAVDRLPSASLRQTLIETVSETYPTPEESFTALAAYLASPQCAGATEVFSCWRCEDYGHEMCKRCQESLRRREPEQPRKLDANTIDLRKLMRGWDEQFEESWKGSKRHPDARLTSEQFGRLRMIENVWARALLYTHYPERCPAGWAATLFEDVKQIDRRPRELGVLLAQLDDNSFQVRERATAELIRRGPAFAPHLWNVPRGELTLEAARRLQRILKKLGKPQVPPLTRRVIAHLAEDRTPAKQKLLDLLQEGQPPGFIGQAVRQAIEDRKKR